MKPSADVLENSGDSTELRDCHEQAYTHVCFQLKLSFIAKIALLSAGRTTPAEAWMPLATLLFGCGQILSVVVQL